MPHTIVRITVFLFFYTLVAQVVSASEHPGNIYVVGEQVRIAVPTTWADWQAIDIDGKAVGQGKVRESKVDLGKLPVGYFEVREKRRPRVTAAVLAKNDPIARHADRARRRDLVVLFRSRTNSRRLQALQAGRREVGARPIRAGRNSKPPAAPGPATPATNKRCGIQHEAGLKILQVNHISPPWAAKNPTTLPRRPARRLQLLSRPGQTLERAGRRDRAVERTRPRHLRRPHRLRNRVVPKSGLPRTEGRRSEATRHAGRLRHRPSGNARRVRPERSRIPTSIATTCTITSACRPTRAPTAAIEP